MQVFSLVVRAVASITSPIAGQFDPGTGGSNVYPLTFKAPDKNGFCTTEQDGGLGLHAELLEPVRNLLHCGAPSHAPSGEDIRLTG